MAILEGHGRGLIQAFILATFLLGASSTIFAADYAVIANKDVSSGYLSKSELQSIFLGEKTRWDDGKPIKIVILKEGAVHKAFLENIIEKTASQYENYWKKLIFTGKAVAPKSFDETSKVVEFVAGQQGAIGYVASGEPNGSVKTITIK